MMDIVHTLLATYAASEWLYAPASRKRLSVPYSLVILVLLKITETLLSLVGVSSPQIGPWVKVSSVVGGWGRSG